MTCTTDDRGAPYAEVEPKRSFDEVPIAVDWHDYLANFREAGTAYASGYRVRLPRRYATGLQYQCTTPGVTSGKPNVRWPTLVGGTVTDGTVVWTAEAMSTQSLRTTIASDDWPAVAGLTLGTESNNDLRYQVLVDGGTSGQTYEVKHQVILANGEEKEAVAVLPVQD